MSELSKETQIEELAKKKCENCHAHPHCSKLRKPFCVTAMIEARAYYDLGFRLLNKGKFVLFKQRRLNRNATYKCSVCGELCSSYYNDVGEWKHCPHCGAIMKGGAE